MYLPIFQEKNDENRIRTYCFIDVNLVHHINFYLYVPKKIYFMYLMLSNFQIESRFMIHHVHRATLMGYCSVWSEIAEKSCLKINIKEFWVGVSFTMYKLIVYVIIWSPHVFLFNRYALWTYYMDCIWNLHNIRDVIDESVTKKWRLTYQILIFITFLFTKKLLSSWIMLLLSNISPHIFLTYVYQLLRTFIHAIFTRTVSKIFKMYDVPMFGIGTKITLKLEYR